MAHSVRSEPAYGPLATLPRRLHAWYTGTFSRRISPDAATSAVRGADAGEGRLARALHLYLGKGSPNGIYGLWDLHDQEAMVATLVNAVFRSQQVAFDPANIARDTFQGRRLSPAQYTPEQRRDLLEAIICADAAVQSLMPTAMAEAKSEWNLPLVVWYRQQAKAFARAASISRTWLAYDPN